MENSEKKKRKKALRISLKILLWTVISIVFAILLSFLLVVIFQDKIEQKVVESLNTKLNCEIAVRDIDVSLFHNFPLVSVVLHDVSTNDKTLKKEQNLLSVKSISFEFNIIDIIYGTYTIKQIGVKNGTVCLRVFEDKTNNFNILKSDSSKKETKDIEFKLNKIYLDDVFGSYCDESNNQKYFFYFHDAKASGDFYKDKYMVSFSTQMRIDTIFVSEMYFAPNHEAKINAKIDVNSTDGIFEFNNAKIKLEDVLLETKGIVEYKSKKLDLSLNSKKANLNKFISLFPKEYRDFFEDYKLSGDIDIASNLKGSYNDETLPSINISLEMKNGAMEEKSKKIALKSIKLKSRFTAKNVADKKSYNIVLDELFAKLDEKPIYASGKISDLSYPAIELKTNGQISLSKISDLLKIEDIKELSGDVNYDFNFNGRIKNISKIEANDFINSKSSGTLDISNAKLQTNSMNYVANIKKINALFSNTDLDINNFYVEYGLSNFSGNATLKEFLPYLFSKEKDLRVSADIHSGNFDIINLLSSTKSNSEKGITFSLPKNISASVNFAADRISYNKFGASKAKASVYLNENSIFAENIYLKTLSGNIEGRGKCEIMSNNKIAIVFDAEMNGLDIRETFIVFDNFGQKDLTYDNLRGKTNISLKSKAVFSQSLSVEPASIIATADVDVFEGKLVGYEPLNGLNKIIKNRDFSDIDFERMTSKISISNKIISIPKTEIKSNVMNLKINGTHTFDNEIEYHLEVKLSDIKNKKDKIFTEDEYGYVVDDGLGNPTFFILITGSINNPKYKQIDKRAMKEKIQENIKTEKQNIKQILKDEFGLFKKDSTLQNNKAEKAKKEKEKESNSFKIEWDEE